MTLDDEVLMIRKDGEEKKWRKTKGQAGKKIKEDERDEDVIFLTTLNNEF